MAEQLARDLMLTVDDVPEAGQSWPVRVRRELLLPLTSTPGRDTTGAGDAFTAALIKGLDQYRDPVPTARLAVAAAGATIGHPGGRPELTWPGLEEQLTELR